MHGYTFNVGIIYLISVIISQTRSLENGLSQTPPMGWMTWQRFRCETNCELYPNDCISENLIKRTVDRIVDSGWREAGYEYVIIDDCWPEKQRDNETQELIADRKRFPNGIEYIGQYIHDHRLKFGIYLDYGTHTCAGYPGTMNFLEVDARSLAKWKVDYVKVDGCYSSPTQQPDGYEEFGKLINETGRPMVYSCSYPAYAGWFNNYSKVDWTRLQQNCNLWRMLGDIDDSWSSVNAIINLYKAHNSVLQPLSGPGHWNDPDMLLLGNFGLSLDQQRVQMGMWCMFAAPLLISADMDNIHPESEKLLKNKHLLSINQDSGGHQAKYVGSKNGVQLWTRTLTDQKDTWAIALMNPSSGGGPTAVSIQLNDFKLENLPNTSGFYDLTDVFTGEVFGSVALEENFRVYVNPTGIQMYKVSMNKSPGFFETMYEYLYPEDKTLNTQVNKV